MKAPNIKKKKMNFKIVGHKALKLRTYHSCDGRGHSKSKKDNRWDTVSSSKKPSFWKTHHLLPSFLQILHSFHSRQQRHPRQTLAPTTICKTFWALFAAPWFSDPGATMLLLPESPTSLVPPFENRESH